MATGDVEPWERTEEPSPRRLREARLDGRIARSPDLATACLVLGAAAMATLGGGFAFRRLGEFLAASLDPSRSLADPAAVGGAALEGVVAGASIVVPAGISLVTIAWLAGVGQVGLVLTTRPLSPRPARLSPAANLAGLASGRSPRRLATDAAKVVAVVLAAWWAIGDEAGSIVSLASMPLADGAAAAGGLLGRLAFAVGTALLAVGLVDWLLERRRIHGELRMTRREAAEDRKETEGDPAWRRRRIEFARGLAAAPAVAVRNAVAIVVGRERGAIVRAVAIGVPAAGGPRIAALGLGEAAARLAALAAAAGVPIVEDATLAESIAPAGARPGQAVARREALLDRLARVPGIAGRLSLDEVPA